MTPNIKHGRPGDQVEHEEVTEMKGFRRNNNHDHDDDNGDNNGGDAVVVAAKRPSQAPADPTATAPARRRQRTFVIRSTVPEIESYIPPHLRDYVHPYHGDFCVCPQFHPSLVAQLMAEGFLPIATEGFLLPKLHLHRCVIHLPDQLHVSKSARKKAKQFTLTVNQAFHEVVAGCRQQHGPQCWLYPPLVEAFYKIHERKLGGFQSWVMDDSSTTSTTTSASSLQQCLVRLYSIELWDLNGTHLVAGELGYTVGSIYTSLTGFSRQDSAGSVQLAALGRMLGRQGFTMWDLGMDMEYKRGLGSHLMPRDDFLKFVHAVRLPNAHLTLPVLDNREGSRKNCRELIDTVTI